MWSGEEHRGRQRRARHPASEKRLDATMPRDSAQTKFSDEASVGVRERICASEADERSGRSSGPHLAREGKLLDELPPVFPIHVVVRLVFVDFVRIVDPQLL